MSGASRVFVMCEQVQQKHNLDGLRKFGEVVFLYASDERLPSAYNLSAFASSVSGRLSDHDFNPNCDRVALVGRILETGMLLYTLGLLAGDINVLFFDSSKMAYQPSRIDSHVVPDFAA